MPPSFFVGAVVVALAYALWSNVFSRKARAKRALARTPRTPVGRSEGGSVRVTGRVEPRGETLTAPGSERVCVAYELTIEESIGGEWHERLVHADARPFAVVDESGTALVDPGGHVHFDLVEDVEHSDGTWKEARGGSFSDHVLELLRAHGVETETFFEGWRLFRYREGVLEAGERVSVAGHAAHEPHADGERRGPREPPTVLVLRGSAKAPLLISDDPEAHGDPIKLLAASYKRD
jgi:hypothetical protein